MGFGEWDVASRKWVLRLLISKAICIHIMISLCYPVSFLSNPTSPNISKYPGQNYGIHQRREGYYVRPRVCG